MFRLGIVIPVSYTLPHSAVVSVTAFDALQTQSGLQVAMAPMTIAKQETSEDIQEEITETSCDMSMEDSDDKLEWSRGVDPEIEWSRGVDPEIEWSIDPEMGEWKISWTVQTPSHDVFCAFIFNAVNYGHFYLWWISFYILFSSVFHVEMPNEDIV